MNQPNRPARPRLVLELIVLLIFLIALILFSFLRFRSSSDEISSRIESPTQSPSEITTKEPTVNSPTKHQSATPVQTDTPTPNLSPTPAVTEAEIEPQPLDLLAAQDFWAFDPYKANVALFEDGELILRSQEENYYFFSHYQGELFGYGEYLLDLQRTKGAPGSGEFVISFLANVPEKTSYLMFIDPRGAFLVQYCEELCATADGVTYLTDGWIKTPSLNFADNQSHQLKIRYHKKTVTISSDDEVIFETSGVAEQVGAFGVGLFQYSGEDLTELRFSQIQFDPDKRSPEY